MVNGKSFFGNMSDEEMNELAKEMVESESFKSRIAELNKHYEEVEKVADGMNNKELYEHINTIINECYGVFWEYKDDYVLEQAVEYKFMNLLENKMELEDNNLEKYIDLEKMTEEQSKEYMFAGSPLHPFTLDDKHFVAYHIYGQGESFLKLKEIEKESAKYIVEYVDMNFIKDDVQ